MWLTILSCFAVLIISVSTSEYTYCRQYDAYNALHVLKTKNGCMDVKTMFGLLHDLPSFDDKPSCRRHIIHVLADHFGADARAPPFCECHGKLDLVRYYTDVSDGTLDHVDKCLKNHEPYKTLYNQFFQTSHSHAGHCRTHHSVWYTLDRINNDGDDHDVCQRDFILHLRYSFEHHSDQCSCRQLYVPTTQPTTPTTTRLTTPKTTHPTTAPTTRPTSKTTYSSSSKTTQPSTTRPTSITTRPTTTRPSTHKTTQAAIQSKTNLTSHPEGHYHFNDLTCLKFDSFTKLVQLRTENGCLSANSVWHYLDDLQVKDPKCRRIIQNYMATKYKNNTSTLQDSGTCTCHQRTHLVDHQIHVLRNGSYGPCHKTEGTYSRITTEFFSKIHEYGCQNHDVLWSKLEGVNNHCRFQAGSSCIEWTDCQQDLIIRASLQYPTDDSDSCVCSSVNPSHAPPTTSSTTSRAFQTTTSTPSIATPTQNVAPKIQFTCDKIQVIESVAGLLKTAHENSSNCVPDTRSSDDAILLSWCNMTSQSTWRKGANVMADCESSSPRIPTYIPISTFDSEIYSSTGSQSGIFLGCYKSGIKMAIQKCNGVPEIVHIEHGVFQNNPRNYYVIATD